MNVDKVTTGNCDVSIKFSLFSICSNASSKVKTVWQIQLLLH